MIGSAAGDLLQSWTYADGDLVEHTTTGTDGARTTRITRDDTGRIARVTGPDGDVEYGYDDACQLTSLRTDGGSYSTWVYDLAGRLIRESVDGAASSSVYDAAGQLLSRSLPDGRRLDYVHDGLGRRVREIASDGSYVEYAWSDLGWLAAVVERQADDTEARRTDLWVDALGELAAIDGAETWWDSASNVPALVSIGGASVFTLPGGATQIGEEWLDPAWRGARATDATDPWGSSRASSALRGLELPGGASLTATGGLQIGGLEWLGARVYDPAAHGFLSVDPLAPVTGAAWAGNPYSYAGNDPMHALDPLGLRPATDADLDAYAAANQSVMGHVSDWADDHAYLIAGAAIVGGALLMATGVGGPLGLALISGGIDVGLQKFTTGEVNWAQAAGSTVMGAVGGGAGALFRATRIGGQAVRANTAVAPTSKVIQSLGTNMAVNGGAGAAVGVATDTGMKLSRGEAITVRGVAGSAVGGFVSGSVGGLAGPAGGSIAESLSRPVAGGVSRAATSLVGAGAGMSGTAADHLVTGEELRWSDLALSGAGGASLSHVPLHRRLELTNAEVLRKFPYAQTQTLSGLVGGGRNAIALREGAMVNGLIGGGFDTVTDSVFGEK